MNKINLIFSYLFILIGVLVIIITSILNQVMPKIGYVAFQAAATGSYSSQLYEMKFMSINVIAMIMIVIGIMVALICTGMPVKIKTYITNILNGI